ncbi:hypothetical protein ACOI3M_09420 [Acinetobacter baumannii]
MSSRKIRSELKKKGIPAEVHWEYMSDCYGGGGAYFIDIDAATENKLLDADPDCEPQLDVGYAESLEEALEFIDQLPSLKGASHA